MGRRKLSLSVSLLRGREVPGNVPTLATSAVSGCSLMSGTTVRMLPRWSVSSYCLLPRAWVAGKDREVLGDVRQLPLLPAHLFWERWARRLR